MAGAGKYMAPEAYKKEAYNSKVDVYAFGIIMNEVLLQLDISPLGISPTWSLAHIEH